MPDGVDVERKDQSAENYRNLMKVKDEETPETVTEELGEKPSNLRDESNSHGDMKRDQIRRESSQSRFKKLTVVNA